jgi:lipid II:glycine glycyltransferase (peptidoglycan interpeptide bridge formation enzyme)
LLQWRMIEWMKSRNVRWYDLARINEKTHPGTTQFKLGLGGKLGIIQKYLGDFESSDSKVTQLLLGAADWFRNHKPAVLNADFHFRRREAS